MTTYVCAVGLNTYEDRPTLSYAVADADAMFRLLTDRNSGTGPAEDSRLLLAQAATALAVGRALGETSALARNGDLLIFYFAGHAVPLGNETFLLLHGERAETLDIESMTRIRVSDIHRKMLSSNASLSLIVLDACHVETSGEVVRVQQHDFRSGGQNHGLSNCLLLYGSEGSDARESAQLGHGVFTFRLLEHLRHGRADSNGAVRVRSLLEATGGDVNILAASLNSDPVVTWHTPLNSARSDEVELALAGHSARYDSPRHPLDDALPWIERLADAATVAGERLASPDRERWSTFLRIACERFSLSAGLLFGRPRNEGPPIIDAEHLADRGLDPNDARRRVLSALGRAFIDPDIWSRRRAGIRETISIGDVAFVCNVIPIGPRPYSRFVALLSSEPLNVVDHESFAHVLRAVLNRSDNLTERRRSHLVAAPLDYLRQTTGFMPTALYERRFELFEQDVRQLSPVYQPIVSILRRRDIRGFEALARDPTGATPRHLFSVADLWGRRFKTSLDLHMARESIRIYSQQTEARGVHAPHPLSLNCFADVLLGNDYAVGLSEALDESDFSGDKLILEISERATLSHDLVGGDVTRWVEEDNEGLAHYRSVLQDLSRRLHVRFALDDFGIERSNIVRLIGLQLSYVKMDRAVIHSGQFAPMTFRYLSDVMGEIVDFPFIVAEGWEESCGMSLDALLRAGCHCVQGFGLGRPSAEIAHAIEESNALSDRLLARSTPWTE
jgi:EAL domain-containing protein (putative c-di-GMP-specific phosphodiesterase class I)